VPHWVKGDIDESEITLSVHLSLVTQSIRCVRTETPTPGLMLLQPAPLRERGGNFAPGEKQVHYNLEELTMKLYCGIDLHSTNHWLTIIDEHSNRLVEKRLRNDLSLTLSMLEPYRADLVAIAIESTYNWYWLVDGLMDAGYQVKLVNTSAVKPYEGLKHSDDRDDAFHLAHLMQLGILPTGYIYPRKERAVRDLLRQRIRLVQQRTTHVLIAKNIYTRQMNLHVKTEILNGEKKESWPVVDDARVAMSIYAHRPVIEAINVEIKRIEGEVKRELKENALYRLLQTVPGIGPILAWIILLETGDVRRFAQVGNFTSYCRCVQGSRISNGKKKGEPNKRNGNANLSWTFHEAAHAAIRYLPAARSYYDRKMRQRNRPVAMKAISHKLARACYFVMRDAVPFDPDKLFKH
jgi:transposase